MLQLHFNNDHIAISVEFQSPLHRGTCFNKITMSSIPPPWQEFQSPLHRGTCFNIGGDGRKGADAKVSVPSSSGHMLQRLSAFIPSLAEGFVSVPSSSGHMLQQTWQES